MPRPRPVVVLGPPASGAAALAAALHVDGTPNAQLRTTLDTFCQAEWWQPTRLALQAPPSGPTLDALEDCLAGEEASTVLHDPRLAFALRGLPPHRQDLLLVALRPRRDQTLQALANGFDTPIPLAGLNWELYLRACASLAARFECLLVPLDEAEPARVRALLREAGAVLDQPGSDTMPSAPGPLSSFQASGTPLFGPWPEAWSEKARLGWVREGLRFDIRADELALAHALDLEESHAELLELRDRVRKLEDEGRSSRELLLHLREGLDDVRSSPDFRLGRGILQTYRNLMPDRLRPWLGHTVARLRSPNRSDRRWRSGPAPSRLRAASRLPSRAHLGPNADGLSRFDEWPIDVVVPIHDSLSYVRRCLSALQSVRTPGTRIILVDDGSGLETQRYLESWAEGRAELITHQEARGFSNACNAGFEASQAPIVVTLNSDTVPTLGWLQRIHRAFEGRDRLGAVSPLSNAASWQSVPERYAEDGGGWAINPLPRGLSPDEMAVAVALLSSCEPVEVPLLNGFCLALRREMLEDVGSFDAANFPQGYGEENDLCLRAGHRGWKMAILTDVYVFHSKSKSFSSERRRILAAEGTKTVLRLHGEERLRQATEELKSQPELARVRARILRFQDFAEGRSTTRLHFLLPTAGGGGGAHSVVQETEGLRRLGIDAKVVVPQRLRRRFESNYADEFDLETLAIFTPREERPEVEEVDMMVATVFKSVAPLLAATEKNRDLLPAYYVQDYEPRFNPPSSPLHAEALRSYDAIPGCLLFAKTKWLRTEVHRRHGLHVQAVRPSIDHGLFHARGRRRVPGPPRLAAMIRPSTPRRAPARTLRVLGGLPRSDGQIRVFGCSEHELEKAGLKLPEGVENRGRLRRREVAELLRDTDLFIDLSDYQAFGRTGLEAMASGATAVLPIAGGASDYVDGRNGRLVDTADEAACGALISQLIESPDELKAMQEAALETARRYSVDQAAKSEALLFWAALASARA
ncbi:MAG: glycosyltransferase [Myxococcota bacterium]